MIAHCDKKTPLELAQHGKVSSPMEFGQLEIKREDIDGAMSSEKLRSIQEVTPSGPVAECGLIFLKSASAS